MKRTHPFGYAPSRSGGSHRRYGVPVARKQTIKVRKAYQVTRRDKKGNPILDEDGKPVVDIYYNTFTKTIYHYDHVKKGRTLADMVYESPSFLDYVERQLKRQEERAEERRKKKEAKQ